MQEVSRIAVGAFIIHLTFFAVAHLGRFGAFHALSSVFAHVELFLALCADDYLRNLIDFAG